MNCQRCLPVPAREARVVVAIKPSDFDYHVFASSSVVWFGLITWKLAVNAQPDTRNSQKHMVLLSIQNHR